MVVASDVNIGIPHDLDLSVSFIIMLSGLLFKKQLVTEAVSCP